jgi:hypothetical protein
MLGFVSFNSLFDGTVALLQAELDDEWHLARFVISTTEVVAPSPNGDRAVEKRSVRCYTV